MALKNYIYYMLYALGAALLICAPTLYNGFPLVYNDSGYYIQLGVFSYSPEIYFWRPLTYSYFLRACFFIHKSFSTAIFIQTLLAIGLTSYFLNRIMGRLKAKDFIIITIIFLSTSFVHFSNYILSDLFAAFLPLSFAVLISEQNNRSVISALSFIFSTAIHYTNLIIGMTCAFTIGIKSYSKRIFLPLLLLPMLLISAANYYQSEKVFISNTVSIFLFSRLTALRVVQSYLDERCETKKLKMCEYRERGFHIWEWGEGSKIAFLGGLKSAETEIREINFEILTSKFLWTYLWGGLKGSAHQLILIGDPVRVVFGDKNLWQQIDAVSIRLGSLYKNQPIEKFNWDRIYKFHSYIQWMVLFLSFSFLLISYFKGFIGQNVLVPVKVLLFVYLLNALICGFFTEPMERYSDRFLWILPLLAWAQFRCDRKSSTPTKSVD